MSALLDDLARAAYEACPNQPHKRVPWDQLAPHWRDYWAAIAKGVLLAARDVLNTPT